jgi:hypothetical protein
MTDYTKSTNFATKDNLSSGNPLKIVKGTEIDTEFNNIATAVATKADLASPTFTGSPVLPTGTTATTQSSSDDTTKLATTAFVQSVVRALHPVGSIYTATVSTNPATLFGFGTWTAFGAGRVLIGNGGGFSAGATGGSADAVVVSHTHTGTTNGGGSHSHTYDDAYMAFFSGSVTGAASTYGTAAYQYRSPTPSTSTIGNHTHTFTTDSAGVSGTNANLQPYIVVYMWQRTS